MPLLMSAAGLVYSRWAHGVYVEISWNPKGESEMCKAA